MGRTLVNNLKLHHTRYSIQLSLENSAPKYCYSICQPLHRGSNQSLPDFTTTHTNENQTLPISDKPLRYRGMSSLPCTHDGRFKHILSPDGADWSKK